jgi:hypothetical protein
MPKYFLTFEDVTPALHVLSPASPCIPPNAGRCRAMLKLTEVAEMLIEEVLLFVPSRNKQETFPLRDL